MRIYGWLKELADRLGSDLYLATGAPACAKFDGALFDLCQAGLISEKEALHNADSENNLRLKFKLEGDQTQPEVSRFTMASDA